VVEKAAEGTRYPELRFEVDPSRVAAFRAIFRQTQGVPPTFVTAAEFSVFPSVIGDERLRLDFARVVHGDESYEYRRPLVEGETLRVRTRIDSIRSRGATSFLTLVTDLVDEDGEVAVVARSTMIERGDS
jgi:acyl dehydratase